jgi:hypothetical protein
LSVFFKKVLGVGTALAVLGVLIGFYVSSWATSEPPLIAATPLSSGGTSLTLETVASAGAKVSPGHPTWVSYLVRTNGRWVRSTDWTVPANSIVHVTIYQFDSATGLRNPFFSQVQGTIGGTATVDGKTVGGLEKTQKETEKPYEEASHTFAVPELGIFVPLPGVSEEAKHPCEEAPCELSSDHHTIQFSFRTGAKGRYHWQCFVPCGAGFLNGNGGPMQTLGYMDGFINVV